MPKVKTLQQARETALLTAIAKGKVEYGLPYDKDVAEQIGLSRAAYSLQKQGNFQGMKLQDFGVLARALHFTGRDLCAIFGVPMTASEKEESA